jgi:hypothetical protein
MEQDSVCKTAPGEYFSGSEYLQQVLLSLIQTAV